MNSVLVISPHPDDESIGCGGAICKHIDDGDLVQVIVLTSGEKGGHGRTEEETIKVREAEAKEAAKILNTSQTDFWRQPDGSFKASEENVKRLVEKLEALKPNIVYVPHQQEEHPDHKEAAELVKQAVRRLNQSVSPVIWMYEVWTPIQTMDMIIDFTPFLNTKRKAILAHKSQCDVLQFDEAILGLNRYRGEMHSWPGGDYAEVFKQMEL